MSEQYELSKMIVATPKRIYEAWLDAEEHIAIYGMKAKIETSRGGRFSIFDGFVTGVNLELEPYSRIVQTWRTSEYPFGIQDSVVEIQINVENNDAFRGKGTSAHSGTTVTLLHKNIPAGLIDRVKGIWSNNYFIPMQRYFAVDMNRFERPNL